MTRQRLERLAYYFAIALSVYIPLHIFLAQSISSLTGGLEVWKAGKDVILCIAAPVLLFLAYKQGAFKHKFFKVFIILSVTYVLLYVLFLFFDKNANVKSAITGSVYNIRILGYLLLGYVVANSHEGLLRSKKLLKVLLIMCMVVASFGVIQYFLPKDFLAHFGYSVERGVKVMFFIDDKPDFPRVMSTLRDPNSLGAFLAIPIVYSVYFLFVKKGKQAWKLFSDRLLRYMLAVSVICLIFTFSRSGLITVLVSLVTMLFIVTKNKTQLLSRYLPLLVVGLVVLGTLLVVFKDTYIFKNLIIHSDESSAQLDPNELRLSFSKQAIDHIQQYPLGEGPGTVGLVAISNPNGGVLTENYYLQIAYEVGIIGLLLLLAILFLVLKTLYNGLNEPINVILFCTGLGIAVFGLLNHSWSNEALAFVWWMSVGIALGLPEVLTPVKK